MNTLYVNPRNSHKQQIFFRGMYNYQVIIQYYLDMVSHIWHEFYLYQGMTENPGHPTTSSSQKVPCAHQHMQYTEDSHTGIQVYRKVYFPTLKQCNIHMKVILHWNTMPCRGRTLYTIKSLNHRALIDHTCRQEGLCMMTSKMLGHFQDIIIYNQSESNSAKPVRSCDMLMSPPDQYQ